MDTKFLPEPIEFVWDDGNRNKNWIKHQVKIKECEQVFENEPLLLNPDPSHSKTESRYLALGKTNNDRRLFISFTIRSRMIRIISARDQSRTERKTYNLAQEEK